MPETAQQVKWLVYRFNTVELLCSQQDKETFCFSKVSRLVPHKAHPPSYSVGTGGCIPWQWNGWTVKLTTYLHVVPNLAGARIVAWKWAITLSNPYLLTTQIHLPVLHGTYITSNIKTAYRNAIVNARVLTKTWAFAASMSRRHRTTKTHMYFYLKEIYWTSYNTH